MASDDASRAAGMWSSVLMCAGIAGDGSGSCTLRSNICDEAGECRPGEAERLIRRLGEAPMPAGYMRGLPRGERRSDGGEVVRGGDGSSVGAPPVGDMGLSACCGSPSFFFPRPSSFRLPFARNPDCSSPTLPSSTAGDFVADTASVVFMTVDGVCFCSSYSLGRPGQDHFVDDASPRAVYNIRRLRSLALVNPGGCRGVICCRC